MATKPTYANVVASALPMGKRTHPSIHPNGVHDGYNLRPQAKKPRHPPPPATRAIRQYQDEHPSMGLPTLSVNLPQSVEGRYNLIIAHLKKVWQTHNAKALPIAQLNFQGNRISVNASTEEALLALAVSPLKHRGTTLPWTTSMGIILPVVLVDVPHAVAPQRLIAAMRPYGQLTNLSQWVSDDSIPLGHWWCLLHLNEGASTPPHITLNGINEPVHLLAASNAHICANCYTLTDQAECTCSAIVTTPADPTPPKEQDNPTNGEHTPTHTKALTAPEQPTVPQDTPNTMAATPTPVITATLDQWKDTVECSVTNDPTIAPPLDDNDSESTTMTPVGNDACTPPMPLDNMDMEEDRTIPTMMLADSQPTPCWLPPRRPQKPESHPYAVHSKMRKKSNSIGASTPHLTPTPTPTQGIPITIPTNASTHTHPEQNSAINQ
ncbi:hypothetical protein IWQ61_007936 [Dispira simplex]|nr:hypothetical protein IWQ61_007936 [Dispira simplex]